VRKMDGLTDTQTDNLMEEIREKTKTVKDLCAELKHNTAVYQSSVLSGAPYEEEFDKMHSETNEMVLQLTSPLTTPKDKEIISSRLSNLVQDLDRVKIAYQKRKKKFQQDFAKIQNAQISFDTEICALNELTVDILGVVAKAGYMATYNRASMSSMEKQIQQCIKEGREHNHTIHELKQKVQQTSDSQSNFILQQSKLPTPRKGFFYGDCAKAPNIFDI